MYSNGYQKMNVWSLERLDYEHHSKIYHLSYKQITVLKIQSHGRNVLP